jgi:type VII secretion protein EccB
MATRRDQLQSYQFLTQRVVSALVMRETDPAQSPLRRGIGAVFAGLMIAVMVGAGFGVVGILTKGGSNSWKADGTVVIEKETGAAYLYQDGVLHPMLNYASALLATGKPNAPVLREPANSLAGTPRGGTLGIPGAPDSLPAAAKGLALPWTLCSVPGAGGTDTEVTLLVGAAVTGGHELGRQALVVVDQDNRNTYLIWNNRKFQIKHPTTVVPALFGAMNPTTAGHAWLGALVQGPDIDTLPVGDRKGQPSAKVPGRKIGDLVAAQTGVGQQFYLVYDDGLAALNTMQTVIYKAQGAGPIAIPPDLVNRAPKSTQLPAAPTGDDAPPGNPPTLAQPNTGDPLCVAAVDAKGTAKVTTGGTVDAGAGTATGSTSDSGTALADRVVVPGGRVAVVRPVGAPGSGGAYYLVTDLGIRYAVASDAALQMLGYQPSTAVDVPSGLVLRIPAGPELSPADAVRPVDATGRTH